MNTQMKIILILIIILTQRFPFAQDNSTQYIKFANSLFESHKYLYAAKLYKLIGETTVDSNLAAEALYKFKKCGDQAALGFMSLYYLRENFQINKYHEVWDKFLQPVFEDQLRSYSEVGINIKCGKLFDLYCVNDGWEILHILTTKYANTEWGELAAFELSTYMPEDILDPREVILMSNNFLNKYPESKFRFGIYANLACAYSDLWNFSQTEYIENLTEDEVVKADDYRLLAIEYCQKIIEYNKTRNDGEKERVPFHETTLIELKEGKSTGIFYFFGD
jgi:hypothetical protein